MGHWGYLPSPDKAGASPLNATNAVYPKNHTSDFSGYSLMEVEEDSDYYLCARYLQILKALLFTPGQQKSIKGYQT